MTFKTHKQFGIAYAYLTLMLLYQFKVFEINYYLCFPIVLLVAQWGAKFPDIDHHYSAVKDKNTVTFIINKIIHLTGGKHRSRHTHSWDILVTYLVVSMVIGKMMFNSLNFGIFALINISFVSGWLSHLWSDSLTSDGTYLVCWLPFKVVWVAKKIFNFRFNTGGDWEEFNYSLMRKVDVVLGFIAVIYPIMPQILNVAKKIIGMIGDKV